ncbi:MAG: Kdo domain containing protein [Bacteroidetes bacterium]|jgi:tRNA A-37 threonylcarbamoyl transferase component Bud32|nr:Kdo domain containing protein [Bacteroidota bacterium]
MIIKIHPDFKSYQTEIINCISNFDKQGQLIYGGSRNSIKIFDIGDLVLNIKAFQRPNFIKKIIYTYFRASKAKRSYNFAQYLIDNNIGTPKPIAYVEYKDILGLTNSYYVCEHLEYDLMFRELVTDSNWPKHEEILRQFTQFCYKLHENGIEFKDHSPGNTLIKKESNKDYKFYLVDLNRMTFHDKMSLEQRMFNLRRLTPKLDMVSIIANEYAKLNGENSDKLFKMLWEATSGFQRKFHRKKRFKNKFKSVSS